MPTKQAGPSIAFYQACRTQELTFKLLYPVKFNTNG